MTPARCTIELAIPKLQSCSHYPDWLLERHRRAEQALISWRSHHLTGHDGDSAAVHTPETTQEFPLLK